MKEKAQDFAGWLFLTGSIFFILVSACGLW